MTADYTSESGLKTDEKMISYVYFHNIFT